MLVDDGLRQPAQPGDIAAAGIQFASKAIKQGRFAAAIRGDDADAVSRMDGEAETGKKRLSQDNSKVSKRDKGHDVSLAKRIIDEAGCHMPAGLFSRDDPS